MLTSQLLASLFKRTRWLYQSIFGKIGVFAIYSSYIFGGGQGRELRISKENSLMDLYCIIQQLIHDTIGTPLESIERYSTPCDLSLNRLDITEVVMAIEDKFNIVICDDDCFKTVEELVMIVSAA